MKDVIKVAILATEIIEIEAQGSCQKFFPHRLATIQENEGLIVEDCASGQLIFLQLSEIKDVKIVPVDDYQVQNSEVEVEQKLLSLKGSGKRLRAVFKVHSIQKLEEIEVGSLFRNLDLVTNSEGDFYLGAYINPNEKLFHWLSSRAQDFELIAPQELKEEFVDYCEHCLSSLEN